MADMIVSGAGSTAVNGTYVESGISSGKPYYSKQKIRIIWLGTQWHIRNNDIYYYSNDDVATPDLCTTWNTADGLDPVPTVTAESPPPTGNPYYYYAQLG